MEGNQKRKVSLFEMGLNQLGITCTVHIYKNNIRCHEKLTLSVKCITVGRLLINSNIYEIPPSMIEHKLKFKEMKRLKEKTRTKKSIKSFHWYFFWNLINKYF